MQLMPAAITATAARPEWSIYHVRVDSRVECAAPIADCQHCRRSVTMFAKHLDAAACLGFSRRASHRPPHPRRRERFVLRPTGV